MNLSTQEFIVSALTLPEPIAAHVAADLTSSFRFERGLLASLEIAA